MADTIAADAEKNGLRTGVYGTRYLLDMLSDYGHADLAYKIATRTDEPGWGWWLKNGHGSMFESWSLDSRSRDHHYFGSIADWMRQRLAGLRPGAARLCDGAGPPEIPAGPCLRRGDHGDHSRPRVVRLASRTRGADAHR